MHKMTQFQKTVWEFYKKNKRDLPWRPGAGVKGRGVGPATPHHDPLHAPWHYRIMVSEIMLQQTQVDRVIPKYRNFIKRFPNFTSLAGASTTDVLKEWQGLGYNSRGLRLKECAEVIIKKHKGKLPNDYATLQKLPGIGPYTAGALLAFVFNQGQPIIETNIRTVYIYHFFKNKENITDDEILNKVKRTLPENDFRNWYYALMDYGSHLKRTHGNNTKRSKHYVHQSKFEGSNRQVRSMILKYILKNKKGTPKKISNSISKPLEIVSKNLISMSKENLLSKSGQSYSIKN